MAVDGVWKLGLVNRRSKVVEGWSEVYCVDQSLAENLWKLEVVTKFGKAPICLELALATEVTLLVEPSGN